MKIVSLKSKNVKNLKAVEITPEGNTVILTGKNGAGKSAVLDSILYAFSGRSIPAKPIREGEESAKVEIDCGEFTVTRTFGKRGNAVRIETKTGDVKKSPQAFLDGIVGKISFDPMEFIRMDSAKQKAVLMDLVGLDVTAMDEKEAGLADKRTEAGREYKKLKGAFDALEPVENPPEKKVQSSDLFKELDEASSHNKKISEMRFNISEKNKVINEIKSEINEHEKNIEEWRRKIESAEKAIQEDRIPILKKVSGEKKEMEAELQKSKEIDTSPIQEKIKTVDQDNDRYRKHQDYLAAKEKLEASVKYGKAKTSALEKYRDEKARKIKEAKYPIEGLSFGSDGVCFHGIPIDQVNSAEQIKVGVAVSMALNPTLKVLRISDGSLLDSNSLKMIDSLITEKDYQLWIEKVDETGKVGVYIEEGEVKSN